MNRVKRIVCSSLVFMLALFVIFQAPVNAESNQIDDQKIKETIEETTDYILNKGVNSEWEAIGIAQSGREVPASYIETLRKNIQSQIVKGLENGRIKITDIERLALATIAVGLDPLNIEELNLIELIYDSPERKSGDDTMTFQGNNGLTFALIALDSLGFEVPEAAKWSREQIINELLNNQNDDGSWPLNNISPVPDIDITAMVITGLSHYKSQPEVATAINRALSWLSSKQLDSGGFDGGRLCRWDYK